jgi:Tfp pilus assembly protein PilW
MTVFYARRKPWIEAACLDQSGFCLAEFLIASFVLLLLSAAVFSLLAESQRAASYQTEVQAVLDNTRMAMETVERYIRQAGNDPHNVGVVGITITSAAEVRIMSDLTGSAGPSNPDKGDPDGDTLDAGEDVTIRYNAAARSIEVVPNGGSAQAIANNISAFTMECYDANGAITALGADVRKIKVSISGASTMPNPQTGQTYGIILASDIQIGTRQPRSWRETPGSL